MKYYITVFFTALAYLIFPSLDALTRDLNDHSQEYETYFCHECVKFFNYFDKKSIWNEFDNYLHLIPTCNGKSCERCKFLFKVNRDGIYAPYVTWGANDNFEFLQDHLLYCAGNNVCKCYWPEKNKEAANISDLAHKLFSDLFSNTALSILLTSEKAQGEILFSEPANAFKFSNKGLVIALAGKSFFYSHYCRICQQLDQYSRLKFSEQQYFIIQNKIENILEELGICYLKLYHSCYLKHQDHRIFQEYRLISQLYNVPDQWPFNLKMINAHNQSTNLLSISLKSFELDPHISPIESYEINSNLSLGLIEEITPLNKNLESCCKCACRLAHRLDQKDGYLLSNQYQANACKEKIDQTSWLNSKLLLGDGTYMNDLMLYQIALPLLTASIEANSTNKDAFIERAMAYFETNQLTLALKDFESAKKLTIIPPFKLGYVAKGISPIYIPKNKAEFSKGLIYGTIEGAKIATVEFIPSMLSCCRGTLNGLWAFACNPEEVSKEMIAATYAIGEFISAHSAEECIQCVVPELKELSNSWHKIDDYLKGKKIGFIIGKYGVDIFAPAGLIGGINKVRALKRANIMCTLESCASSEFKQAQIIQESIKRAVAREIYITEAAKRGNILVKNSNIQYHVMQQKHAWEKVLKLSGNVEEDFKKVILLLEESSILSEECFLTSRKFAQNKIIRSDYQKTINGHTIHSVFETYIETNQTFLQDAWVVTL